jgi:hypothetical protein
MFFEVRARVERRPGLQHHHTEATLSQNLGGRATRGSRAYDADVINLWGVIDLRHEE